MPSAAYMRDYRARKRREKDGRSPLFYDFNDPPNDGGFREVVLDTDVENSVRTGDIVTLSDGDVTVTGRVRCLVAIVSELGPVRSTDDANE